MYVIVLKIWYKSKENKKELILKETDQFMSHYLFFLILQEIKPLDSRELQIILILHWEILSFTGKNKNHIQELIINTRFTLPMISLIAWVIVFSILTILCVP